MMSNDISSQYTKEENKKNGRRGWYDWKREKETVISPRNYGEFLQRKRGKR